MLPAFPCQPGSDNGTGKAGRMGKPGIRWQVHGPLPARVAIKSISNGQMVHLAAGNMPVLSPFQTATVVMPSETMIKPDTLYKVCITIREKSREHVSFTGMVSAGY